jgi:hypothetical protein
MIMPNFLLIGAAKAGTSSMYSYLALHPEIYMSKNKEPQFFAYEGWQPDYCGPGDADAAANRLSVTNLKDYQDLFREVNQEKAIGEASTHYLYTPEASKRIKHYIPDAKLIAILRNPVDRAYSAYLHLRRDGREPLSNFIQALNQEEERKRKHWSPIWRYKEFGFYSVQLQRYFDLFDSKQIKIYLYEDWKSQPINVIQDIFRFLEVDDSFVPDMSVRYNTTSRIPKNNFLHKMITKQNTIRDIVRTIVPPTIRKPIAEKVYQKNIERVNALTPEVRKQLIPTFREDILRLQDLIQRDLSAWLQ